MTNVVMPVPEVQAPEMVVQRLMNVVVPLRDPSPAGKAQLVVDLAAERDALTTALTNVGTVHFARFNIVGRNLEFLSVYDGMPMPYLLEFALQVGAAFDAIVAAAADWPPPPFSPDELVSVTQCPAQFAEWVLRHDRYQIPRDPGRIIGPYDIAAAALGAAPGDLSARLVARFRAESDANLSSYSHYPGFTAAKIRAALGIGW